ncbi:endonuclease toxin domain-containing protein [Comamonas odontotermitis]|uniref:endonuclease toxin domain-containing protein n=1 Tax=Comamonas odontotermitis TaxID=379895 RepID=UPI001CC57501|nr:hypothetical protein [Comamonas odontotermitis]UBB16071.1 hypothetical protein LAD35_14700 [Comamonas odontotermitis]
MFDKQSLQSVLTELNTACSPPRYCTADEKNSIQELNQFYAMRDSIKPDTTAEELLLGNKVINTAFKGVAALYGRLTGSMEVEALGGVVAKEATGVEFGKGINGQGKPFESYVQSQLPEGTIDLNIIKSNFKTFDHLTPEGVAVSTKTMDTVGSVTYQNPNRITSTLNGYVDDMVNFVRDGPRNGRQITSADIASKQMQLAIPYSTTPAQMDAINRSMQYAADRGIAIVVTRLK